MAFAAVHGDVPPLGWWLFAINLFWVVAYDTEYAMVDRDDDLRLGMRTSAITFGRFDVLAVAVCYASTSPAWRGSAACVRIGAALSGSGSRSPSAFAVYHLWLIRDARARSRCFRAFLDNHWLGFAVFAGIVARLRACRLQARGRTRCIDRAAPAAAGCRRCSRPMRAC